MISAGQKRRVSSGKVGVDIITAKIVDAVCRKNQEWAMIYLKGGLIIEMQS